MSHSQRPSLFPSRRAFARASPGLLLLGLPALAAPARAASEGGLVLVPDPPMLLALMVLFGLLVYPANALLFQPILRVLDERAERIQGTRARAERLAAEADGLLERHVAAVADARQQAEQERRGQLDGTRQRAAEQIAGARSEAESEIEGARGEVMVAFEQARGALRSSAGELAEQAASRVLGRPLA